MSNITTADGRILDFATNECTWCGHNDCDCRSRGDKWKPWRCDCPKDSPR